MTKVRSLRVVTLSLVVALMAVLLMAFTVSAHPAAPAYAAHSPATPSLNCKSVPITNIVISKKTKRANYKPNNISVKVSSTLSFCITNKTSASQDVTYNGSILVTIPSKQTAGIRCNTPNNATFSLSSNPKAKLAITCK